jgi:hypothetical protein
MATLTEISSVSRKIIKYGSITIIVLSLMPVVLRVGKMIYARLNPPPVPPPTVQFGKLPLLQFPSTNDPWPEFKLETIEGRLPTFPDRAKVYLVGVNKSRLLLLDRTIPKAKNMGFSDYPLELNDQSYRFVNQKTKAEIQLNLVYGTMTYLYDWTKDKDIYYSHSMPRDKTAINQAVQFFARIIDLPSDLSVDNSKVHYYIATGSAMMPTDSYYDANMTRVDLFRNDKDKMKIMTAGVDTSPISVVLSGRGGDKDALQANFYYSQVFDKDFATYPLRSIDQAWKELLEQKAYIARKSVSKVIIRRVSMAYYESMAPQLFMQPIYVFEGDGGFTAYVQAVDGSYLAAE